MFTFQISNVFNRKSRFLGGGFGLFIDLIMFLGEKSLILRVRNRQLTSFMKFKHQLLSICIGWFLVGYAQVPPNINSGNPNFPFPQFKGYKGGAVTLALQNPVGMPHAELEQRTRDAYRMMCNNMTYNVNRGGTLTNVTVGGVRYIQPNNSVPFSHCTCVEADGYYLLAAAYMGDKPTFDGYFMWMHDRQFQKTQRYIDGVVNSPGYNYSPGISGAGSFGNSTDVLGGALGGNSAGDGDVDLALALLVAWKQWGPMSGITPPAPYTGGQISYRDEAIKYIRTMVDTLTYAPSLPVKKYISGVIGFDGYMKGGDTWTESSNWAQPGQPGYTVLPERSGGSKNYVDYHANGYFHSFANMLQAEGQPNWGIQQYRRAEASGDWVMGQAYAQGLIPWISEYEVNGTNVIFDKGNAGGEGFRYGWRTILNYLWHGAPTTTWNPVTHSYAAGTNTYNLDMAKRFASLLKKPESAPFNNVCFSTAATMPGLSIGGPANLRWEYDMDGTNQGAFKLPMPLGPMSPSAVVSGEWDLMAQLFRQCVISFDDDGGAGAQRYLTANPHYFHEWFRLLGMLVLTGNLHDPLDFTPAANMKVYKSVNKTFAYVNDTVTYTISYRNYGKNDATSVIIKDTLDPGYTFLSENSGKVTVVGNILTWNIGLVKGMNTGDVKKTQDSVKFTVLVNSGAPPRICNTATITEGGVFHWKSNEYPNRITEVMERNCVDILGQKPLALTKKVDKTIANPGDVLTYTITVKNRPTPFLNGGRQGVFVVGATNVLTASMGQMNLNYRLIHGAHEPLINYKNYRVSYFANQNPIPTWANQATIEGTANAPSLTQQTLPAGANWNHRFILTFPDQLGTTFYKLVDNRGDASKIHQGATAPFRMLSKLNNSTWANFNALDDWSTETNIAAGDNDPYFPLANNWTDPLLPNQPVTKMHPDQCGTVTTTIKKQLVEEWDGYVWRRIYGDAPVTGRELANVVVKDYLPPEVDPATYTTVSGPVGTVAGSVVTFPTITELLPRDSVVYVFTVKVKTPCTNPQAINRATAKATNEPLVKDSAITNITGCTVPLHFVHLSGKHQDPYVNVDWAVSSVATKGHYEIWSSADNLNWSLKGSLKASAVNNYNFAFGNEGSGMVYVKVRYVSNEEQIWTQAIAISNIELGISIVPNPFVGSFSVTFAEEQASVDLEIYNIEGKLMQERVANNTNRVTLGEALPAGVYFLKVNTGEEIQIFRLVSE